MERIRPYLPVLIGLGILLVIAIPCWLAYQTIGFVRNITDEGVQRVAELAGAVETQVSNVVNPTPTIIPDPITIVHEVRSLARLETIQYSVEKVITAEQGQGWFGFLFGDRILFVAHGTVVAGVDLQKLQPEDLRVENGILYVTLPPAEVFVATLNNDDSYVYDRQLGALARGGQGLETEARRAAENQILQSALEDGILQQAQVNAESYLLRLFLSLGFPEVIFEAAS